MKKFFNTAGLCFPGKHYMVEPLQRLPEVKELIERELYFTIHAPRQTGKTTYLYALALHLNDVGEHIALVVSFEQAGYEGITVENANEVLILSVFKAAERQLGGEYLPVDPRSREFLNLNEYLSHWADSLEKPVVLLIDEIDALLDEVLVSVLRQLRDGYQGRPSHFPSSVALVGLRDVRDYKVKLRPGERSIGTSSPFNVKARSLFLENFSLEEVFELLEQHTAETGQEFSVEVKEEIFRLGAGQPWLTNALANEIVSEILRNDVSHAITMEMVQQAKKRLILRRDTHLDSLIDKLRDERVRWVAQAIVNGDNLHYDILDDDISYVRDLGLVSSTSPLKFANPIYAEIVPRLMASSIQESIPEEIQSPGFVDANGQLDMEKALKAFQEFYRENADVWTDRFVFKESAHHLLLMAFLQRVLNAGGSIAREMAVGKQRVDLLVTFHEQRFAMELKIKRGRRSIDKGKEQLARYLDQLGLPEGYLVIFDAGESSWEEKLFYRMERFQNKRIYLVGV
jgi:hypothetical protein